MPSRSRSGHFDVVATNPVAKIDVFDWTETLAAKLERTAGRTIPFGNRSVLVVVEEDPASGAGRAEASVSLRRGDVVLRLTLCNPQALDPEDASAALCRLLLNLYVFSVPPAAGSGPPRHFADRVPPWLFEGLAEGLHPETRARNIERCLQMWESGEAVTVSEILREGRHMEAALPKEEEAQASPVIAGLPEAGKGLGAGWTREQRRAVRGTLLVWIMAMPQHTACFESMLGQIAAGTEVSADSLARFIPGCSTSADVEDAWDKWLLRQKHVVRDPGVTTATAVERLGSELLLYPGVSGIPLAGNESRPMRFSELIEKRNAVWISSFVVAKTVRLQLLAAGHSREYQDVAEAYCRFLAALGAKKPPSVLRPLLAEAELKWSALQKAFGGAPAPAGPPVNGSP